MPDHETHILTHQEAAEFLKISKRSLVRLVDNGEIPFLNFGSGKAKPRRKYFLADLETYANHQRRFQCHSIKQELHRSGSTTSNSTILDFMDRLNPDKKLTQ